MRPSEKQCNNYSNWQMVEAKSKQESVIKFDNFDKWWRSDHQSEGIRVTMQDALIIWNTARQGMIPAANAIQIPDVSEWNENTKYLALIEVSVDNGVKLYDMNPIHVIPRPKPQWTPEVGDTVFVRDAFKQILVGRFNGINDRGLFTVITSSGYFTCVESHEIKSFDPAKIGLSWEQI